MIIRYEHMFMQYEAAKRRISRACDDLSNNSFERFLLLKKQFYIMPNLDVYVDDDMDPDDFGYIEKCLRADHLGKLSVIVPNRHDIERRKAYAEKHGIKDDAEESNTAVEPDNLVSFEDYFPELIYDDGHFEEEYLSALNHHDHDDDHNH